MFSTDTWFFSPAREDFYVTKIVIFEVVAEIYRLASFLLAMN